MDEAAFALENRTQAIVSESLSHMDATRAVIARRPSTIRHADRIYVVDADGSSRAERPMNGSASRGCLTESTTQ